MPPDTVMRVMSSSPICARCGAQPAQSPVFLPRSVERPFDVPRRAYCNAKVEAYRGVEIPTCYESELAVRHGAEGTVGAPAMLANAQPPEVVQATHERAIKELASDGWTLARLEHVGWQQRADHSLEPLDTDEGYAPSDALPVFVVRELHTSSALPDMDDIDHRPEADDD